jgi:hypothetical protein
MATNTAPQQSPSEANMRARALVLAVGVDMKQQIFAQQIAVSAAGVIANPTVNVPVNNVGLIKGFLVKVQGTITAGAQNLSRSEFGASNFLSQIVFTDLTNTVRIQTAGWHMGLINSAKQPMIFGGAYAPNVPVDYGNNWTVMSAPATINATTDGAVQFYYYVPLAYSAVDLRGAMYAGVVNATSQLQLSINTTPCVASTGDQTLAMYISAGAAAGGWKASSSITITVWQNYLDQLPLYDSGSLKGTPILPQIDLSTIYELKTVSLSSLVQSQDFGIPYANFRTFLSTCVVYDNGGQLNVGTDINYFALRASNTTSIFQFGPQEAALFARKTFMADVPKGVYYFDMRDRPISTQQFGNMNLVVNPSLVNANAALLVGFEDFAMVSQVQFASSLPSGGA